MPTPDEQFQTFHVLTLEAVRWGIKTLEQARIHPFFLAYLHLRKRAVEQGSSEDILPNWEELGSYMHVRGGPPGKPYYRPLWNGKGTDPGRYWLNRNLAGSYAPSSLRNVPIRVVETHGSHFSLREGHARLAFDHLLYEQPVPAIALAAYLYRNFGFSSERWLGPSDLRDTLMDDFHYPPGDSEFDLLFDTSLPTSLRAWFEPFTDPDERG